MLLNNPGAGYTVIHQYITVGLVSLNRRVKPFPHLVIIVLSVPKAGDTIQKPKKDAILRQEFARKLLRNFQMPPRVLLPNDAASSKAQVSGKEHQQEMDPLKRTRCRSFRM